MISRIVNYTQKCPFVSLVITLVFLFCYQSLNIFWGFELADSGYHLTAYDNIFDAPDSVSANFCYYLTNVLGGVFMNSFPEIGIVGFRILGALFVDCAILLIFLCLRKEIPVIHLLIGGVLVVMSYIQIPYSFNNGICSCFLYICALLSLYKGLVNEKYILVFISGVLVGVNFFSRIPNVLAVGLVLIMLLHEYIENGKYKCDVKLVSLFLLGITLGVIIIYLLIIELGHQQAFKESLNNLFHAGMSSSNGHSLGNLIWAQICFYLNAIIFAALFFSIIFVSGCYENHFCKALFVGLASFVIFYHVYLNFGYEPLWAICAIGCCLCLNKRGHLALLASLAFYMLIVEILGSGGGNNHGSLPALLAAPVTSYTLIKRKNIIFVIVACMAFFVKVIKQGNFNDFGPLFQKIYFIDSKECKMISTTKEISAVMNNSLPELKQYVQPGDTLLVYDSAPMMNYLTHTRPAGGLCWPGLGSFVRPFETAPKILIHKFVDFTEPARQTLGVPTGNQMIDSYMQEHQYQVVWENPYFMLLLPRL